MTQNREKIFLFSDGSVNPQSGVGFGAYLLLKKLDFSTELQKKIKIQKFEGTSSTQLELETLLWALSAENLQNFKIVFYTDCQNIIGLQKRREGLESKNYRNSKGKLIKNHEIYKDFFKMIDAQDCEFEKVQGHKKSSAKNEIDEIFTLVDRATRRALREIS